LLGHRYRFRSLIADFLRTTDAFSLGNVAVQKYLLTEDALGDESIDIVQSALRLHLEASAPKLPGHAWSLTTLVNARPAIRAAVGRLLASWHNESQYGLLAKEVARLLGTLRDEEICFELRGHKVEAHPGISPGTIRFADGRVLLLPREPLPQLAIATSESFLDCSTGSPVSLAVYCGF
jgi:hypothetical protein